jgi:predicted dehydrogenase
MRRGTNRRAFLKATALTGAGFWVTGNCVAAQSKSANEKLQIASIGVGGKGSSDCQQASNHGKVIAICDCDERPLGQMAEKLSDAEKFSDFREMLTKLGKKIDAVTVSTADHSHAPASIMAMRLGKHVYCQKPLTHTVWEARMMRETAKKYRVATQMGNQGTAENGLRRAVEIIQAGVLGGVREVHVWTNRPIWPQGPDAILQTKAGKAAALAAVRGKVLTELPQTAVPKNVNWDVFLGAASERPYDPVYHPFSWRGWWDFGTGAIGDMACHTANMAFMALKLGYPTSVVAEAVENLNPESCPTGARVVFQAPARGDMPELKFVWYEGINRSRARYLPPDDLLAKVLKLGEKISDSGSLLVGDKGILFSPNDYGAQYRLIGDGVEEAAKKVPESLPRNGKGDDGMKAEWAEAIKSGKPEIAMSNFDYAGSLTEFILLGNIAMRFPGTKLDWDGPNLKFTNRPEPNKPDPNQYVSKEYRKGWEIVV